MKGFHREEIIVAISKVLEHGDQDELPWSLYPQEREGPLARFSWTRENVEAERSNFIEAVIAELDRMNDEQYVGGVE
jgi:hypothetical protein